MKKLNKFLIYISSLIILSSNVLAARFVLGGNLNIFGRIDIAGFYLRNSPFIDAVVYMLLFLSLAQLVFTKVYPNNRREAKMIAVAIGLALTVGMVMVEMNTGFNLGKLGIIALILLLSTIAILLFNFFLGLFTGEGAKGLSAALTYLLIYGLLVVPFGTLNDWINTNAPLISALMALVALAAFIFLILAVINMMGFKSGSDDDAIKNNTTNTDNKTTKEPIEPEKKEPQKKLDPWVRIVEPLRNANKTYSNKDPIVFGFEVSDVNKPYKYMIVTDNGSKRNNVTMGRTSDTSVGIPDLRNGTAKFSFPGNSKYRIILYILNDNNQHILNADGQELIDYTEITCIDTNIPTTPQSAKTPTTNTPKTTTPNTLIITSPITTMRYYAGNILPITFDVDGPDHKEGTPFIVRMHITSRDGLNDKHNIKNIEQPFSKPKNMFESIQTAHLPPGIYEIGLKSMRNGKDLISDYSRTIFRIEPMPAVSNQHNIPKTQTSKEEQKEVRQKSTDSKVAPSKEKNIRPKKEMDKKQENTTKEKNNTYSHPKIALYDPETKKTYEITSTGNPILVDNVTKTYQLIVDNRGDNPDDIDMHVYNYGNVVLKEKGFNITKSRIKVNHTIAFNVVINSRHYTPVQQSNLIIKIEPLLKNNKDKTLVYNILKIKPESAQENSETNPNIIQKQLTPNKNNVKGLLGQHKHLVSNNAFDQYFMPQVSLNGVNITKNPILQKLDKYKENNFLIIANIGEEPVYWEIIFEKGHINFKDKTVLSGIIGQNNNTDFIYFKYFESKNDSSMSVVFRNLKNTKNYVVEIKNNHN